MRETVPEWLERQADRTLIRQRSQVDTAKLVATFAAGVAATLVATALQVGSPSAWDIAAVSLLGATVAATVIVISFDRLTEANHPAILQLKQIHNWSEERLLEELQASLIAAVDANAWVLTAVKIAATVQVMLRCSPTLPR